jgi:multisubunit Na+/H+ antiporter MnhG subunit
MYPSLIAHIFGALILLIAIILIFCKYNQIISRKPYDIIILLVLISGVITLHGISHLGLEYLYGYNPLAKK